MVCQIESFFVLAFQLRKILSLAVSDAEFKAVSQNGQ